MRAQKNSQKTLETEAIHGSRSVSRDYRRFAIDSELH